ncbi:hypothetical protein OPV22_000108 [Ensete ventricosum]|uniref:Auxin response factor n=1 Tax=Ensete ventricosum TaxID=4639 RepID=A0AAV8RI66_ENSVE|nr:hypothetical protein OPV22_000108 [Ensete ventricosum]
MVVMLEQAAISRAVETRASASNGADATERRQLSTESQQLSSSRIVSSVVARVSRLAQLCCSRLKRELPREGSNFSPGLEGVVVPFAASALLSTGDEAFVRRSGQSAERRSRRTGHSEQVAASTNKEFDSLPSYPSLPPQLVCQLHNVTMHADVETDEVYGQMTLQPLSPQEQKDPYLPTELGTPTEKVFPPLDFSQQPPAQELIAKDLHGNEWKFRHIFRGQPKRHLLTTGWSVFVSAKRLVAGDSVLFIWNDNNQLLLGIRRANRPQTVMPSSVLSSDSMHIGLLAAAAHAAATNSRFTIFYNPRASPSEFVIPLAKYVKAVHHTRVSVGMRFRMLFETEESSVRRYMGTITGISDLDPVRWPNSHWRSVKVGWDESTAGQRQPRVSLWEIEPLTTFPMYPSPFPFRLKRPWPTGLPSLYGGKDDISLNSPLLAEPLLRFINQGLLGGRVTFFWSAMIPGRSL